jgi:hypothetical protein
MSEIIQAICNIMQEVSPISKNRQGHGFKYRGIDDAYSHLQMLMAKHGVVTVPKVLEDRTEERQSRNGGALIYRILKISYTFYHTSGSSFESIVIGEGMDSSDKASNKAMSVAHKYALLQVFCIPTEEPKDPEIDQHEVAPKYLGSPQHKRLLMSLCNKKGITDVEVIKGIAERAKDMELSKLDDLITVFLGEKKNESSNSEG